MRFDYRQQQVLDRPQEALPLDTRPIRIESRLRASLSWALFLLVSLAGMTGALAKMADAGPGGTLARSAQAQGVGGAVGLSLGQPPDVHAPAAYVFDPDSGFVYYTKNANQERPMASTTKIMTLILAVEHGNLDQMVTIGPDAAALVRSDSSFMGVSAGEQLSMRDLLYGLVLPSGNDAAVAIADAIGGSVDGFVGQMNARAHQLGLSHTHFVTPHGLDMPGHYTSAHDLAVMSAVAMKNPEIVKITSALRYTIPQTAIHKNYDLHSGNDLLSGARAPYPGAIGVKPGFTGDAEYCMGFAAVRHGHLIVGTVLGDPSWQVRIDDMRALLDWGFAEEGIGPAPAPVSWQPISPDL